MIDIDKVIESFDEAKELVWTDDDYFTMGYNNGLEEGKNIALTLLEEQEQKTGHWIVLEYCANEGIYCSKCLNKIFDRSTKPKKKLSNYCPNCGSKNTHFFNPSTEKIMYSD